MPNTIWLAPERDGDLVHNLAKEAGISETVAQLLVNRGVTTAEDVHAFLSPTLDKLHDPMLLPDMQAGVERVARALKSGEKILVHGDYDVDGVTSAALLIRTLNRLGGNIVQKVPHRIRDGYDIKPMTADDAAAAGVGLILTADCGVTACSTIERAETLGVDIVITDHHVPGPELPKAVAVINPMRRDSNYPYPHLAGVGVALKFAQALVRHMGYDDRKFIERFLDLAAMGTIADVMPLTGENRVIAKFGLAAFGASKKVGLQAMMARTGLEGKPITSHSIGFILGPRINAAGRMDDAAIALRLMLTADRTEADDLAETLEHHNSERQEEQARIVKEVQAQLEARDLSACSAIVLFGTGWNTGVVGIAASKVVEQYGRPAILLSLDEEAGMAHGSARSIEVFNMINALDECRELLDRAGGHALAAGLALKAENLPDFEAKMNLIASQIIKPEDMVPRLLVDGELDPQEISWNLVHDIGRLEPFGPGNPEPVFTSVGFKVMDSRRVGAEKTHLKLKVRGRGGALLDGIAFGMGELQPELRNGDGIDLCYNIRTNSYNGNDSVQLMVRDIRGE